MAIEASVGARVGDYILVKKLGEGGMAEVWLSRHATSAQLRAIKFLNKQFQGIPEVEARFQTEGESQLVHPNIVRIYEVGQHQGSSFLAMDFIDGRDLEKILDSRRGPLTVPEAVDIAMQILAGLGFAHQSGIVHRDIKPSNVLVDSEGQAYLMDFGIAKALRGTRSVTQVNSRLGTPDYMSPEQIRNPRDVDRRSDIYSFGCMFYELLTGWPPFDRGAGYETEHDIKTAHVMEPPTPPLERKPGVPVELNEITLHCLAKAKEDRPQSCEEILGTLVAFRESAIRAQQASRSGTHPGAPKLPTGPGQGAGSGAGTGAAPHNLAGYDSTPGIAPATGPGVTDRRATEVLGAKTGTGPSAQPAVYPSHPGLASGYGGTVRTSTVTDEAIFGPRAIESQPSTPPPAYVPTGTQTAATEPAKGNRKMVMVFGSLLLMVALSGGAYAIFHKEPPAPVSPTPVNPTPVNPVEVNPQLTPKQVDPKPPVSGTNPTTDQPKVPPVKTPQTGKQQTGPQSGTNAVPTIVKPVVNPPAPLRGTLVWTGNPSALGQHITIIRSIRQATPGGFISGDMFPQGPVQVTVRPAGAAIVTPPEAHTHYNSLEFFLPNPGQQTIYLDWTEIQNP